jgi:hypothetical protein
MGTRWESVIIEGPKELLASVAKGSSVLAPLVLKQRLAIGATAATSNPGLWTVKCMGFRSGDLGLTENWPASVIPGLEMHSRSADLALAQIASTVTGVANWIRFSDSLGTFVTARFCNGIFQSTSITESTQGDEQNYARAAVSWFRAYFPDFQYIEDDLFEAFKGESMQIPVIV